MAIHNTLESAVEKHLRSACAAIGVLCWKLVSPGTSGVPDRILVGRRLDDGAPVTLFVELKAPDSSTRALQDVRIAQLRRAGAIAVIIDGARGADLLLAEYFGAALPDGTRPSPAELAGYKIEPGAKPAATFSPEPADPLAMIRGCGDPGQTPRTPEKKGD